MFANCQIVASVVLVVRAVPFNLASFFVLRIPVCRR